MLTKIDLKRYKKRITACAVLLTLIGACLFVWLRPPVVIVTDNAFLTLYGAKRALSKQRLLMARLFRRTLFANVADDAVQDAAVFTVGAVSANPFLVIFPERFASAAETYAAELKTKRRGAKTRVCVLKTSAASSLNNASAEIFEVDRKTDVYRAGLCAAVIAGEGNIFVFSAENTPQDTREAFSAGLKAGSYTKEPTFKRLPDTSDYDTAACIVILSGYSSILFSSAPPHIPTIMFTWLNPAFTPDAVKIVFDDSPLGVASQIAGGHKTPHSETHLLVTRLDKKSDIALFAKNLSSRRNFSAAETP